MKHLLTLFLLAAVAAPLPAQLRLNEAVTSNASFTDEDGDTPDWLELRNAGGTPVELAGYTLSDKRDRPAKWTLAGGTLEPGDHLLVWASGKDRPGTATYRTLIDRGAVFRYRLPDGPVAGGWTDPDFNDGSWATGATGFGYGDGDDATGVPFGTRSVFLRRTFTVADPAAITDLILDVDFDDGFVAYLNGAEVGRRNLSGDRPAWDQTATTDHEAQLLSGGLPDRFTLDDPQDLLRAGTNVLAIQVHNVSAVSSDLTLIPFLSARYAGPSSEGSAPPAVLGFPTPAPHTNFKLSAAGETLYLHAPDGAFVDSLPLYGLPGGVSYGIPAGGGPAVLFDDPTPGGPNPNVGFAGVVDGRVTFSQAGGPTGAFTLSMIGGAATDLIRYTLDGSDPGPTDPVATGGLDISETTVVRAAIFRTGYLPSPVTTATYLVDEDHELPVVAITTEPANFFDPVTGIYVLGEGYQGDFPYFGSNIWEDIEHPAHFALYPTAGDALSIDLGTKIFGGYSRGQDQRSLSFFARGRYGADAIDYPLFPQRPYAAYQAFVLRNSGNDLYWSSLRDGTLTSLMLDSNVDVQAYRPAVSYVNGRYWGIFNLREKVNEHFLASLHDVDPDEVNLVELNGQAVHGSAAGYNALVEFAANNDLRDPTNYRQVAEQIDLPNYLQYQVAQIYFDNRDWPGNNIKYWNAPGKKWRWILFDTDFGAAIWDANAAAVNTLDFALDGDGPNWPNPPWSTLLLRRLVANPDFRHRFVNQFADEMNVRFRPGAVQAHILGKADAIYSEIPRHNARWGRIGEWEDNVWRMIDFFYDRPAHMRRFLRERFDLPAERELTITNPTTDMGSVRVNTLAVTTGFWRGTYFEGCPVPVRAIPHEGYRFVRWELDNTSTNADITIDLTGPGTLRPIFAPGTTATDDAGQALAEVTDVSLSPNPSTGALVLRFTPQRATHLTARLLSADGKLVQQLFDQDFSARTQVQRWSVPHLAPGVYYLELSGAGDRITLPWSKQ